MKRVAAVRAKKKQSFPNFCATVIPWVELDNNIWVTLRFRDFLKGQKSSQIKVSLSFVWLSTLWQGWATNPRS